MLSMILKILCPTLIYVSCCFLTGCGTDKKFESVDSRPFRKPSGLIHIREIDGGELFGKKVVDESATAVSTEMIFAHRFIKAGVRHSLPASGLLITTRCKETEYYSYCLDGLKDTRSGKIFLRAGPGRRDLESFRLVREDWRVYRAARERARERQKARGELENYFGEGPFFTLSRAVRVAYASKDFVSIYLGEDEYTTGGAHHNNNLDCMTYSRKTGKRLRIRDILGKRRARLLGYYTGYGNYYLNEMSDEELSKFPAAAREALSDFFYADAALIGNYSFLLVEGKPGFMRLCFEYQDDPNGGIIKELKLDFRRLPAIPAPTKSNRNAR